MPTVSQMEPLRGSCSRKSKIRLTCNWLSSSLWSHVARWVFKWWKLIGRSVNFDRYDVRISLLIPAKELTEHRFLKTTVLVVILDGVKVLDHAVELFLLQGDSCQLVCSSLLFLLADGGPSCVLLVIDQIVIVSSNRLEQ